MKIGIELFLAIVFGGLGVHFIADGSTIQGVIELGLCFLQSISVGLEIKKLCK